MTKTFTPETCEVTEIAKTETAESLPDFDAPSLQSIRNILNFSRNLEVIPSGLVSEVEFTRS